MTNKRLLSPDEKRTGISCNDCDDYAVCIDSVGDYLCKACFGFRYDPKED